jgi:hypothetical protein
MRCYIANRLCTIVGGLVQVQAIDNVRGHSMPIELHAFDTPNGRKISVALEEMALPYIVTIVDIRRGDQFDPEFLKLSGAYLRRAAASALTQA